MGVVYTAYDPQLDRKLALKLLRALTAPGAGSRAAARLLREGQALARLAHPNVISVHDVGTHEGQVFVAMELVEGGTLRDWLISTPRPWREILAMFVQAGRGLAAAHAAGLVHRDFKADNVLVGRDGRARVVDFGLAHAGEDTASPSGPEALAVVAARSQSPLGTPLTENGELMGTPLYMAPEQLSGERTDAASDQFSFCVTLFEALYGVVPFEGRGLIDLASNVQAGMIRELPATRGVPTRVLRILRRGLSVKASDRYPSMDALLRELERDPDRARQRVLAAVGGAAAVAGLSLLVGHRVAARAPPCAARAALMDDEWNAAAAERVRAAFAATGRVGASDTFDHVRARIDDYAKSWARARVGLCEAEKSGTVTAANAGEQDQCLTDEARALGTLVDVFEKTTEASVVDRAIGATDRLGAVDDCKSPERSAAHVTRPADPALRARVEDVIDKVQDARTRGFAGKPTVEDIEPLVAQAKETGYGPAVFFASYHLGAELTNAARYPEAEAAYREALAQAARTHATPQWFAAITSLANIAGLLRHSDEVRFYLPILESAVDMAGDDLRRKGYALLQVAQAEDILGHPLRAAEVASQGADVYEESGDGLSALFVRSFAARALGDGGRYEDAVAAYSKAVPEAEKEYGSHHAKLAYPLKSRAYAEAMVWKFDEAHADARRAQAIYTEVFGPEYVGVSDCLESDGVAYSLDGRPAEAIERFERAIDLRTKAFGPDAVLVGFDLSNLGGVQADAGDLSTAEASSKRAVAIARRAFGKDHPDLDSLLEGYANIELRLGHLDEAAEVLAQALGERRARKDADPMTAAGALLVSSRLELRRGHVAEARKLAEEAVASTDGKQAPPGDLSDALLSLGDAAIAAGDVAAATAALERGLALVSPLVRETHPKVARLKERLGEAALAGGDAAKAYALFESVVASQASWTGDPEDVLRARFGRARASWELGGDRRAHATEEATAVRALASPKQVALPELRDAVTRWLKGRSAG
jgi:tetratricopeptide (TPR) repeat protein